MSTEPTPTERVDLPGYFVALHVRSACLSVYVTECIPRSLRKKRKEYRSLTDQSVRFV